MKKELLKISIIFFVTVFAVVWALNYIYFGQAPKSKAAGETVSLSFSPSTVSGTTGLTTTIKALPSAAITLRGYKFKVSFDKNKVQITDINYRIGTVSLGLGDSNSTLSSVNTKGVIAVQGEIYGVGQPLLTTSPTDVVIITFTSTTASSTATITEGTFYIIGADFSISPASASASNSLSVNGGTGPTNTPVPTVTPGGPTATPIPTVTPGGPTLTPNPTVTDGASGNVNLKMKLKFQGITTKPPTDALNFIKGKIEGRIVGTNEGFASGPEGNFLVTSDNNGVWSGTVNINLPQSSLGKKYTLFIKGRRHIQKKICDSVPSETSPGIYRCYDGNITLVAGDNNLDFSGIILLVGDLDQNGIVDSIDFGMVRNNLGTTDTAILSTSDLNLDGKIDTQDFSLIIAALSIRTDEQ